MTPSTSACVTVTVAVDVVAVFVVVAVVVVVVVAERRASARTTFLSGCAHVRCSVRNDSCSAGVSGRAFAFDAAAPPLERSAFGAAFPSVGALDAAPSVAAAPISPFASNTPVVASAPVSPPFESDTAAFDAAALPFDAAAPTSFAFERGDAAIRFDSTSATAAGAVIVAGCFALLKNHPGCFAFGTTDAAAAATGDDDDAACVASACC
jgi:hypothetical protein